MSEGLLVTIVAFQMAIPHLFNVVFLEFNFKLKVVTLLHQKLNVWQL